MHLLVACRYAKRLFYWQYAEFVLYLDGGWGRRWYAYRRLEITLLF